MKADIKSTIIDINLDNVQLYLVNIVVQVTDGDMKGRRFISVGTRVFKNKAMATGAAKYQEELKMAQLEENWLNEDALMDRYGPWREVELA